MTMPRGFKGVWIPREIWLNRDLKPTEKILLVEIDSLDTDRGCFAGNAHFAEFLDLSKTRVSQMISKLQADGYITLEFTYKPNSKQVDRRFIRVLTTLSEPPLISETPPPLENETPPLISETPPPLENETPPLVSETPPLGTCKGSNTSSLNTSSVIQDNTHTNYANEKFKLKTPPDFDQVADLFGLSDLPDTGSAAVEFFRHYEAVGWVTTSNQPITNWKAKARQWIDRNMKTA